MGVRIEGWDGMDWVGREQAAGMAGSDEEGHGQTRASMGVEEQVWTSGALDIALLLHAHEKQKPRR